MTTHEHRLHVWLMGISIVGLMATLAAATLLWIFLTRPIAVVTWVDKL